MNLLDAKLFLEPKKIEINGQQFIISKFPATVGREIICGYPLSSIPKLNEYKNNEELMFKLMRYVAKVMNEGDPIVLENQALIDNHVKSWETLMKLEKEMLVYNCSFFQDGRISTILRDFAQNIPTWISKILMDVLERFAQTDKQPSTSLEQNTP